MRRSIQNKTIKSVHVARHRCTQHTPVPLCFRKTGTRRVRGGGRTLFSTTIYKSGFGGGETATRPGVKEEKKILFFFWLFFWLFFPSSTVVSTNGTPGVSSDRCGEEQRKKNAQKEIPRAPRKRPFSSLTVHATRGRNMKKNAAGP